LSNAILAKLPNGQSKKSDQVNKSVSMAYEQMSYIDDLQRMHTSIEELMKHKGGKLNGKRKKVAGMKSKEKSRRSATPSLFLGR